MEGLSESEGERDRYGGGGGGRKRDRETDRDTGRWEGGRETDLPLPLRASSGGE